MFFGCRVSELRLAKKEHFDFDKMLWTVPPENHKVGRRQIKKQQDEDPKPIIRPIINEIVPTIKSVLLLSRHPERAFTSSNLISPMRKNVQVDLPYGVMNWVKKHRDFEMKYWSTHDLRRTTRTNASSFSSPLISQMMLGHSMKGLDQVYNHYDYLPEMREAYTKWWDRLNDIVGEF